MAKVSRKACVDGLIARGFNRADASAMVDSIISEKERLSAEGKLQNAQKQLSEFVQSRMDEAQEFALQKKRNEALNVIARVSAEDFILSVKEQGYSTADALVAMMVGSQKRFKGSENSAMSQRWGILNIWESHFQNKLEEIGEASRKLLSKDEDFQKNVFFEVFGEGTGDSVAAQVAKAITGTTDMVLARMNNAGANIGKLKGWFIQDHNVIEMVSKKLNGQGSKESWIATVADLIDVKKTFGDVNIKDVPRLLEEVYENITSGRKKKVGEDIIPAGEISRNVLAPVEKHRIIHFKDAQSAWDYRQLYGHGDLNHTMHNYLESSARTVSLLEKFGPSPESNIKTIIKKEINRINDDMTLDPAVKKKEADKLKHLWDKDLGGLKNYFKELDGQTFSPVNKTAAAWAAGYRAVINWSSLGFAALSAFADIPIKAINIRSITGLNIFQSFDRAFRETLLEGRTPAEQRRMLRRTGAFLDGTMSSVHSRMNPEDRFQGFFSKMNDIYFRATALTQWTQAHRNGYISMLTKELGHYSDRAFADIEPNTKAMMERYGINAKKWEVYRKTALDLPEGGKGLIPDEIHNIAEIELVPLLPEDLRSETMPAEYGKRLDKDMTQTAKEALYQKARKEAVQRVRNDMESTLMGLYGNETKYAIIEPDDKTRAHMVWGTRPGTWWGEGSRFISQFKGFPMAYMQRQVMGQRWKKASLGKGQQDIGGLVAFASSMMMFGYATMTIKDMLKGKEPRDPMNWKTASAALMQSGGFGLFGDFIFGKVSRTGNSLLENLAGPAADRAARIVTLAQTLAQEVPQGNVENLGEDAIRVLMGHSSFNTWYTYLALQYGLYTHIQEWLSPGTEERRRRREKRDYGQEYWFPNPVKRGGGFK